MSDPLRYRPLKEGDEAALAAACAFAREPLYERLWLHGVLEVPALRARSEIHQALYGDRLVGMAAAIEGLFPFRFAPLEGALPGAAEVLLQRIARPFVCSAPARLARQVERSGGRAIRTELLMVRFDAGTPLPAPDARVERVADAAELARFCGSTFAPLELELGPFFAIRDALGELAAVAGARFVTDRVALLAHLETREDCRRRGFARALATAVVRELETRDRRVTILLPEDPTARSLFASLGFRGAHELRIYAF